MLNSEGVRRLLVLDDDSAITATICAIADRVDFEARASQRASEFFEMLDEWRPSHVIVDLVMPGIDGIEVISRLAQRGYPGRVIVMSGLGDRSLDAAARMVSECGLSFSGLLKKPFASSTLRLLLTRTELENSA